MDNRAVKRLRPAFWKLYEWRAVVAFALILAVMSIRGELKPVKPIQAVSGVAFFVVATACASWYVKAKNLSSPRPF